MFRAWSSFLVFSFRPFVAAALALKRKLSLPVGACTPVNTRTKIAITNTRNEFSSIARVESPSRRPGKRVTRRGYRPDCFEDNRDLSRAQFAARVSGRLGSGFRLPLRCLPLRHLENFALPTIAQIRFKLPGSEDGSLAWGSSGSSI
jgi:hypothetical protein